MDTSSESDSYERRMRGHRGRGRESHRRSVRDRSRDNAGGNLDLSDKISTLANTLQDTSRNLTKVDRMLGQYREHADDQAEAMTLLRESLEDSINQLQTKRRSRSNGVRSSSASSMHTSDLEACSGSEEQRFYPTSPLRDYSSSPGRRRRSQSAGVRFKDSNLAADKIHTVHQTLRDLRCDQQRLSDDLDREILRRNRSDIDTRRAMENLTEHMTVSQRQETVSSRVERRLQELEREMQGERRSADREQRAERRANGADHQQEIVGGSQVRVDEREDAITARLLRAEREKSKMEQELGRARRLLEQSEESRESLVQQVEDMRGELLQTKAEKMALHRTQMEASQLHASSAEREGGRGQFKGSDNSKLEKEVAELQAQLNQAAARGEVEELKRLLDRKERENLRLNSQVKELSSDLEGREQQQLRILEQLKDIQIRGQTERREMEALLLESTRSRNELKSRAQEAVRQWRAKCRRLQQELEDARAQGRLQEDKAQKASRENEGSQAQLKALSQQTEAARRELGEILRRLTQREEEIHRKDVELSETRQRQVLLQQEIQEVREASAALEQEAQLQTSIQARLREEKQRLEEQADSQARCLQRDQDAQAELQAALKQMTDAHAHLSQRLSQEDNARKELQKDNSELQARLTLLQEERSALSQQLQLEREVHQKELENMKATMKDDRMKKDWEVQERLKLCQQERDEIKAQLREAKADAASDKELCAALNIKLDRMKDECDKLVAQLGTKDEAHSLLQRKYQQLKQDLEDKVRLGERRRVSESELARLEKKVLTMEADQETVLTSLGEELDAVCRSLARNGEDKLQAISQRPGLVKDPHRWLSETKIKLRWLCEEVQERDTKDRRLRKQHQQTRDQLKALRQSLDQQEKLLLSLSTEKKELLERSRRKEEEMRSLQDRVLDLEMSTRVALEHLESLPEKKCLMEDFKDLEESQQQKEFVEQRYVKYREIVRDLQHQLDESKRRIQEYRDEKLDATSRSLRLAAFSCSIKDPSTFLSSTLRSDCLSPPRRLTTTDLDDSTDEGSRLLMH
ncbi:centrosomal protein of 128 kDa-like isoform X1 [Cyprinodon tularosa]|uniref:centrosomal protein of 128 kDa-like isoform X1 n=1 Tax=Cyprinodon tularosa TaxID=77115 RepID=UPI0018E241CB|nr:centrosomal protein of 128 kDa-like isoform X1 [Cyprinodon tularosa]